MVLCLVPLSYLLWPVDVGGTGCHVTLSLSMSQTKRGYILETSQTRLEFIMLDACFSMSGMLGNDL